MRSITLIQLSYIVAVHQTRNFGLAAKRCFVSQPTLSMQIQKVEEEMEVILFDRSKKPVEPTAIGIKLIQQAQTILQEFSRLQEIVQSERGEIEGKFSLGVIPTLAPYLLPIFLEEFVRQYPKVHLVIEELQTRQIVEKLGDDLLDAGILVTPLKNKQILESPLFHEPFVIYLSPRHPLYSHKNVSAEDLNLDDIWLLNEGHCFRDQVLEICKRAKATQKSPVHQNLIFESGNLETLKGLVDQNFGYTLLPYLATLKIPEAEKKKKLKPFKSPIPNREVSLVYSRSFLKQGIIEALGAMIKKCIPRELQEKSAKGRLIGIPKFR
jgi:LysR family hydrogen peroxide-inducible transcriptional activator